MCKKKKYSNYTFGLGSMAINLGPVPDWDNVS